MEYVIILFLLLIMSLSFDRGYEIGTKKTQGSLFCYVFMFMAFVIFAAIRDVSIGADTMNYYRNYNESSSLNNIGSEIESSRYQPFWIYTVVIIKEILKDFNWLLAIESLFLNIVVFRFLWKFSKYPFLCITLYFCMVYIGLNFETLREGIAVALCLLAYEQLIRTKYVIAILLWICAFEFHVSAVIALLYPLLKNMTYSKVKWSVMLIIGSTLLLIFPLLSSYIKDLELILAIYSENLADRLTTYGNTGYNETLNINYYITLVFRWIIIPFVSLFIMRARTKYFGFIMLYIYCGILGAFSEGFLRFANYYVFFYIIYLADLGNYVFRNVGGLKPVCIICYVLILMYLNESLVLSRDILLERYYPYKSISF